MISLQSSVIHRNLNVLYLFADVLISEEESSTEIFLGYKLVVSYDKLPYTCQDDVFDCFSRDTSELYDQNGRVPHPSHFVSLPLGISSKHGPWCPLCGA